MLSVYQAEGNNKCKEQMYNESRMYTASLFPVNVFQLALKKIFLFGHPRATWVFSKLQGIQHYFPENFSCTLKFYESENFLDSSLHHIFGSENLRFPFSDRFLAIFSKREGILRGCSAAAMKGSAYLSR